MRVLKVVAEGMTTSFRYPHFMQGIHPTFEMPPPATIYGHICSALGEWIEPHGVKFAYRFTCEGNFHDVEHVHVLTASSGKMPNSAEPKALEGAINPFKRAMLFRPKLVLYVNRPEWKEAFRSPRYTVVLGRSQDLFTYTSVSAVDLEQSSLAYFEHTLLPYSMSFQASCGYTVLMPRFLDYANGRSPTFERYLVLPRRVRSSDFLRFEGIETPTGYWVDPTEPKHEDASLGLSFLSFVDDDEE